VDAPPAAGFFDVEQVAAIEIRAVDRDGIHFVGEIRPVNVFLAAW
jgi:hypothetical protein